MWIIFSYLFLFTLPFLFSLLWVAYLLQDEKITFVNVVVHLLLAITLFTSPLVEHTACQKCFKWKLCFWKVYGIRYRLGIDISFVSSIQSNIKLARERISAKVDKKWLRNYGGEMRGVPNSSLITSARRAHNKTRAVLVHLLRKQDTLF
jgi:hypothetical protein